jgi:endonuclease/exonuclease/phosphatase family metal-dependent hydrolase
VYGSAHDENKMAFLAELSNFCSTNSDPMIIGGDFNIIRYLKEKNTMDDVHRHTALFNSLIHFYGLRELTMNVGVFTWSNNQEPPVLERLDRILMTKEWEDLFPQAIVNKLPREISDHNPLIVSSGKSERLPHLQFKFNLSWLQNPDFFTLVEKIWTKPCKTKSTIDKIQ